MRRKLKFWLLLTLGILAFVPPLALSVAFQVRIGTITFQGALLSLSLLGSLAIYCTLLCKSVYRKRRSTYPIVPPEGRMDIYFPRSGIPRPIFEDEQRHPDTLQRKKMKKYQRRQRKASSK